MEDLFKRFGIDSGIYDEKDEFSSSTFTSTTTTTSTRYENGVPVEVITKTYTNGEPSSSVKEYDENRFEHIEEIKSIEKPLENSIATTTRYENGVPVEVITKTYTNGKSQVEMYDDDRFEHFIPVEKLLEKPIEMPSEKPVEKIVEKPTGKPNKRTEERDHDKPEYDDSNVVHKGERSDPASRCSPVVDMDEFKEHLDLTGYDFSKVDKYARETPYEETENCSRLSEYLTSRWNEDLDKLRCIFTWIAENIRYDTDALFGGNIRHYGPESVLKMRKAVCDGYAGLFDKLASDADLRVWRISGKSKGAGFTPGCKIDSSQFDHAWNCALYKGEYLLIDNTWGAGYLNGMDFVKCFEPFYFLCSPTQFIYSHFPEKPEYQYVKPTLTKEEFLDLSYVKPKFFTSGLNFVKHLGNVIEVSDDKIMLEIERVHPDESKPLHATLEWEGHSQDIPVMIQRLGTLGPKGGRKYRLLCTCPSMGEGNLEIYVMLEGNRGPLVSKLKVKNSGSGKNYVPFVDTFKVPFSFTIQNPIHAKLNYNDHIKFEITIFDLPESELPLLALFLPEGSTRKLQKVSSERNGFTFAIETCVDQRGKWNLTYSPQPNNFSFIAQYLVE